MVYRNPVLCGFHPDPSACRVGSDYYLATSSFEYFPGVPLFHSLDLVNWRQIGHCLTRKSQLDLSAADSSGGIFAPTLRYHNGIFYMITTNVGKGGNFFVTATDPRGPWSDPIWVDEPVFDPSLFFDDDGKVYYSRRGETGIVQAQIDIATGKLTSGLRVICEGFLCRDIEGPHVYKIGAYYYLLAAEGGTRFGHSATIGRCDNPWGPFEPCPHNPIITHRDKSHGLIRDTGHAELIDDCKGIWWLLCLGTRHRRFDSASVLGRETFLCPVSWRDGWPAVEKRQVCESYETPVLTTAQESAAADRDGFDSPSLKPCWNFIRNPYERDWSLTERPGWLRLRGSAICLSDKDSPAFVGRRQQHFDCAARTLVEFVPCSENEEAGMCAFCNDQFHYTIVISIRNGRRCVIVKKHIGDVLQEVLSEPLGEGAVELMIRAESRRYRFCYRQGSGGWIELATGLSRLISPEVASAGYCWTGVFFGLFASGNGVASQRPADFDWCVYEPQP